MDDGCEWTIRDLVHPLSRLKRYGGWHTNCKASRQRGGQAHAVHCIELRVLTRLGDLRRSLSSLP